MSDYILKSADIFKIQTEEEFNRQALRTFFYQYQHVSLYRKFCDALGRNNPKDYSEIPFLPLSFFKSHSIVSDEIKQDESVVFKSSGTTGMIRSKHIVLRPEIYEEAFTTIFKQQVEHPENTIIFALLPNYIQQGNSSLIYMVNALIKNTNHPLSGFYLDDYEGLIDAIEKAKKTNRKVILFGVSYALLDLAEQNINLSEVMIFETGGMKGRRKEMVKEELHEVLKKGFQVPYIYSEYGMTELLSQAYLDESGFFTPPKWMKIQIREVNDPFHFVKDTKTGGVNIIDLANFYSCSFLATDDLGITEGERFKIVGRFDESDIRGCNLLVQ